MFCFFSAAAVTFVENFHGEEGKADFVLFECD